MSNISIEIYEMAKFDFVNEELSITKVAERYNINRKTLSKMLKQDGIYNGKQKYPLEYIEYAKIELEKGNSLTNICKHLKVSRYNFTTELNKRGIYRSDNDYYDPKYDILVYDYMCGVPSKELMKEYNICESKFYNILNSNKIYSENKHLFQKNINRKYSFNQNFFDDINTEEKAYWLGFLMADGYNSGNIVELSLQAKDINHIEKFKQSLGYNGEVKYKEDVNAYRISLCSQYMCKSLDKLGCVKAKSLILEFPLIKDELLNHFIRGYFDGDGTVGNYLCKGNKTTQCSIEILGTENFVKCCNEIISFNCDVTERKRFAKHGGAYSIRYSGNRQCKKILDWLYKDATVYLDRKYNKYNELIAVLSQLPQKG